MVELYVHGVVNIKVKSIDFWNKVDYIDPYYCCKIIIYTKDGKETELTLFSDFQEKKQKNPYDFSTLAKLPAVTEIKR